MVRGARRGPGRLTPALGLSGPGHRTGPAGGAGRADGVAQPADPSAPAAPARTVRATGTTPRAPPNAAVRLPRPPARR
ncbi:hypothetical protein CG747_08560 [Streptomyces sp. CB02959]|nr:hypothetical protein CG747_08560 [Streptomyces sp. CB02959]